MRRFVSLILFVCALFGATHAHAERVRYHQVYPQKLVLGDPHDGFISYGKYVRSQPGQFDVIIHGNPATVAVKRKGIWRDYTAPQLARLIRHGGWNGRDPVRMISCQTGLGAEPIARKLARVLGVPVRAPAHYAFLYDDGSLRLKRDSAGTVEATGRDAGFREFRP